jgi:hypothetical protein
MELSIIERLFSGYFYVRIKPNSFIVTDLATDEPSVPLYSERKFTSSRLLICNYELAVECLNQYFKYSFFKSLIKPSQIVLIHPERIFDDDYSEIEKQSFKGVAYEVGAREVVSYEGQELSKEDALRHLRNR